eukprot:scaffold76522_cov63-Phaeocystis_antarctica.AAC.6
MKLALSGAVPRRPLSRKPPAAAAPFGLELSVLRQATEVGAEAGQRGRRAQANRACGSGREASRLIADARGEVRRGCQDGAFCEP